MYRAKWKVECSESKKSKKKWEKVENAKGESRTVKEGGIEVKKEKVEIVKEDRKVGLLVVATLCTK